MRHIHKGLEPASFTAWKAAFTSNAPDWEEFGRTSPGVKKDLKDALLREQSHVCCYCERDVTAASSHVEHLVPKSSDTSVYKLLTYDSSNLLASCEGEKGLGRPPETCGHLKKNQSLPVHPLMPDCGDYFVFRSSGAVDPANDAAKQAPARDSMTILGLDSARIVALRRMAIEVIDNTLPSLGSGSPEEIASFRAAVGKAIQQCSRPDAFGRLTPFSTALVQHLQRYL